VFPKGRSHQKYSTYFCVACSFQFKPSEKQLIWTDIFLDANDNPLACKKCQEESRKYLKLLYGNEKRKLSNPKGNLVKKIKQ